MLPRNIEYINPAKLNIWDSFETDWPRNTGKVHLVSWRNTLGWSYDHVWGYVYLGEDMRVIISP